MYTWKGGGEEGVFREQEIEELGSQFSEVVLDFNTPKQQKPKQSKAFTGEG